MNILKYKNKFMHFNVWHLGALPILCLCIEWQGLGLELGLYLWQQRLC